MNRKSGENRVESRTIERPSSLRCPILDMFSRYDFHVRSQRYKCVCINLISYSHTHTFFKQSYLSRWDILLHFISKTHLSIFSQVFPFPNAHRFAYTSTVLWHVYRCANTIGMPKIIGDCSVFESFRLKGTCAGHPYIWWFWWLTIC